MVRLDRISRFTRQSVQSAVVTQDRLMATEFERIAVAVLEADKLVQHRLPQSRSETPVDGRSNWYDSQR